MYYYFYDESSFILDSCPHLFLLKFCPIDTNTIFSHRKLPIIGQTGHGWNCSKHKVVCRTFLDDTSYLVININNYLIKYVSKILVKKKFGKLPTFLILLCNLLSRVLHLMWISNTIKTIIQEAWYILVWLLHQCYLMLNKTELLIKLVVFLMVINYHWDLQYVFK